MNDYVERLCDSGLCSKDKCTCKSKEDKYKQAIECGLRSDSLCNCPNFNGTYGTPHTLSQCGQFGFKEFTLQEHFELKNFMDKIIEVAKRDSDKRTSSIVFLKLLEEIGEYTAAKVGDKKADEKPHEELVDTIIAAICLYSLEGGSIEHLIEYGRYKLRKYDKKMGF